MSLKFTVQLDFNFKLFIFLCDDYFIYKQSEVCVTDCSFLDDFFDDFISLSPASVDVQTKGHRGASLRAIAHSPTVPVPAYSMFSGYSSIVRVAVVMSLMQSIEGAEGRLLR